MLKEPTGFKDRNNKEIFTGDILKYKKIVCGGDFIFVAIKRTYQGKTEFGLHRQGFYEPMCAGCWDYTKLSEECYSDIKKTWKEASKEVKSEYDGFRDYADRYCINIIGNVFDKPIKEKLDPQYMGVA